jgi:uncharacterized OB-fold protein
LNRGGNRKGTVYTETVVHAAPTAFASEAPYQVAIVRLEDGGSVTARIVGERVAIGDLVVETEPRHDAPAFRAA